MHVAICDDNVADRKQFERLIKRESDKRAATTGIVYADSFGNAEALLVNPRQYDVFYIDMCQTEDFSMVHLIDNLREKGVTAPIFLCCSQINYRENDYKGPVFFINKPIRTEHLSNTLDQVEQILAKSPSLIELRDLEETLYVGAEEILYAVAKGHSVTVTLTYHRTFETNSDINNLFSQWAIHGCFAMINNKTIINAKHVKKFGFMKISMKDGNDFMASKSNIDFVKGIMMADQLEG